MRPKTIVYFEGIIFGTLLLSALQSYLGWDVAIVQSAPSHRDLAVAIIIMLIFEFVLPGTLTLLVSRRRNKTAMWVLIVLGFLGISLVVSEMIHGRLHGSNIIAALQSIGQVVAYGLLFTSSARRWMNGEDERVREAARGLVRADCA